MRSKLFIFLCLGFIMSAFVPITVLTEARKYFVEGAESKVSALTLKNITEKHASPIYKAYNGASYALLAKHYNNPYTKLESLKKGLKIINQAAEEDVNDIEIRFIRFSVEEHIPSFVSFTSHLAEDKARILSGIKNTHEHYEIMRSYLLKSKKLSDSEKKILN
jgi:hypothetical protein